MDISCVVNLIAFIPAAELIPNGADICKCNSCDPQIVCLCIIDIDIVVIHYYYYVQFTLDFS